MGYLMSDGFYLLLFKETGAVRGYLVNQFVLSIWLRTTGGNNNHPARFEQTLKPHFFLQYFAILSFLGRFFRRILF